LLKTYRQPAKEENKVEHLWMKVLDGNLDFLETAGLMDLH